jgi:tRNA (mo5U34)-methyltransferase
MRTTSEADVSYEDVLAHQYWRHRIDLGDGRYTPGTKDASHWHALGLPESLDGKTVLDVGAFDGLVAIEAERRGAERVLATDVWPEPPDDDRPNSLRMGDAGIELVCGYLDSDVERRRIDVHDLSPETVGTFDVVVFSGVITELKEPFAALERVVSVADELVVVESVRSREIAGVPAMVFSPAADPDGPGLWTPSVAGLTAMVEAAGCRETDTAYRPVEERASPVPTPQPAVTGEATTVFRTQALTEAVDSLAADRSIQCLYRRSDGVRVEYRDREAEADGVNAFYQGWVPEAVVDRSRAGRSLHSSVSGETPSLPAQALGVLREEGVRSLARKGVSFLRRRASGDGGGSHVVVHGTPD